MLAKARRDTGLGAALVFPGGSQPSVVKGSYAGATWSDIDSFASGVSFPLPYSQAVINSNLSTAGPDIIANQCVIDQVMSLYAQQNPNAYPVKEGNSPNCPFPVPVYGTPVGGASPPPPTPNAVSNPKQNAVQPSLVSTFVGVQGSNVPLSSAPKAAPVVPGVTPSMTSNDGATTTNTTPFSIPGSSLEMIGAVAGFGIGYAVSKNWIAAIVGGVLGFGAVQFLGTSF